MVIYEGVYLSFAAIEMSFQAYSVQTAIAGITEWRNPWLGTRSQRLQIALWHLPYMLNFFLI